MKPPIFLGFGSAFQKYGLSHYFEGNFGGLHTICIEYLFRRVGIDLVTYLDSFPVPGTGVGPGNGITITGFVGGPNLLFIPAGGIAGLPETFEINGNEVRP